MNDEEDYEFCEELEIADSLESMGHHEFGNVLTSADCICLLDAAQDIRALVHDLKSLLKEKKEEMVEYYEYENEETIH
tara:strand:- start:32 stop:265 length:234 start_codon:yes stop_codon:yes gene_type:complete